MAKKPLTTAIDQAYIQGISTRSIGENDRVKATGMNNLSKIRVSRLWDENNDHLHNRPIK